MSFLTDNQVFEQFKQFVLPGVIRQYEADRIPDKPARCEAFNNYVDGLHRDNKVSDKQVNNICIPDELETTYKGVPVEPNY